VGLRPGRDFWWGRLTPGPAEFSTASNNDLYRLDLSTLAWTSFADVAPPPGRALASLAADDDTGWLLLFGGVLTGATLQDVFKGAGRCRLSSKVVAPCATVLTDNQGRFIIDD
jgi:hypothetical protein